MLDVQEIATPARVTDGRRPAFLVAGPLGIVSLALVFAAAGAAAGDSVAIAKSGLGIASSVTALAALIATTLGLVALPQYAPSTRQGFGRFAWLVALIGAVLTVGGYWSSVFVQPGLATSFPAAVRDGLGSVTAGFVVSYMTMGIGWALLAIALLRAKLIGISGWFLILASVIAISPAPFRYVPLTIAVTFACGLRLGRRRA